MSILARVHAPPHVHAPDANSSHAAWCVHIQITVCAPVCNVTSRTNINVRSAGVWMDCAGEGHARAAGDSRPRGPVAHGPPHNAPPAPRRPSPESEFRRSVGRGSAIGLEAPLQDEEPFRSAVHHLLLAVARRRDEGGAHVDLPTVDGGDDGLDL